MAFLIGLIVNSEEAVIQTVNWNILETPVRTHLSSTLFSTLQRRETYVGDLGTIDSEIQELVQRIVDRKHFSVIVVPVFRHRSKCVTIKFCVLQYVFI